MPKQVALEGRGLHAGKISRVTLVARPGPVALQATGIESGSESETPVRELVLVDTDRATTVQVGGGRIRTVEHLFAAFGGLGVHAGVAVRIEGEEMPHLDGSARLWCEAIESLGVAPTPALLEVVRDDSVQVGAARYTFARAQRASGVAVRVDFADERIARDAAWSGDPAQFRDRIATARTFAFAHELDALAAAGLASHTEPESVVVLTPDAIHSAGRTFEPDEPARHKLLDLVGDLFLYGGPPAGRILAERPGHTATHAAMRLALQRGIVARA